MTLKKIKDEEKYYDRFGDVFAEPEVIYDPPKDEKKKGKPSFP